jgi:hypothetical protein
MSEIKKIDIKEFREKGYLQELNRQFLHPLGLALAVSVNENGEEMLDGIWDYREDDEGIIYDLKNSNDERIKKFIINKYNIENESLKFALSRQKLLGYVVEPIILNDIVNLENTK